MSQTLNRLPASVQRRLLIATGLVATVTLMLLVSRLLCGIDFTDEMQHYGELVSLARTGRLFQVDLFLQQLGYVFFYPVFKVYVLLNPHLDGLVLFGRSCLLLLYLAVGALLWRSLAVSGIAFPFRCAGLFCFLSWVPFELFSIFYNTLAHLLCVSIAATWLIDRNRGRHRVFLVAVQLVILAVCYPPVGLAMTGLYLADRLLNQDRSAALRCLLYCLALGTLLGGGLLAGGVLRSVGDFAEAVAFTRSFSVGQTIRRPQDFHALLLWGSLAAGLSYGLIHPGSTVTRLAVAAKCHRNPLFWLMVGVLSSYAIERALRLGPGDFILLPFFAALIVFALGSPEPDPTALTVAKLGVLGACLGAVFAVTSSNGMYNFGLGLAIVLPFVVAYAGQQAQSLPERSGPQTLAVIGCWLIPLLIILNGVWHPYRETKLWHAWHRVQNVPVFAGIHTSSLKTEAIAKLQAQLSVADTSDRSLFVAGPHPWLYFIWPVRALTPMIFMHDIETPTRVNNMLAAKLLGNGSPDIVILAGEQRPAILQTVSELVSRGYRRQELSIASELSEAFQEQTGFPLPSTPAIYIKLRETDHQ